MKNEFGRPEQRKFASVSEERNRIFECAFGQAFFSRLKEGQCCVKFMELCLKERITRKKKLLSCFQFKLLQL